MNYRAKYRSMPPLAHHVDPAQSEVVAHIRSTESCDDGTALSIWEQIRRPSRKIVVFDRMTRTWSGYDTANPDQTARLAFKELSGRMRKLEKQVAIMQCNFDALVKFVNNGRTE